MDEVSSYKIEEFARFADGRPTLYLEITSIMALPCALRRLAEMGYDMRPALNALQAAVEDQNKQSVLHAAINALVKPV